MKDSRLQAVHDDDLITLLTSLGKYDKVCAGQCSCHFCGQTITLENLGAIVPQNGEIAFSCDSLICINNMLEEGNSNDSN